MRVSSKNQITLPVAAMRRAGIEPGDDVNVDVEAPGVLRVSRAEAPVDQWVAALTGVYGDDERTGRKLAWRR